LLKILKREMLVQVQVKKTAYNNGNSRPREYFFKHGLC
jgi:hypothetical protein